MDKKAEILKVFIGGARAISYLDVEVIKRLENICNNQHMVFVGDASGIDSSVQKFFSDRNYSNILVFAANGKTRNNYGNWQVKNVPVADNVRGFNFYAAKDVEMANLADCGLMVWDGKSRGTFNNMVNLTKQNKMVVLYNSPQKKFYKFKNFDELNSFINNNKHNN